MYQNNLTSLICTVLIFFKAPKITILYRGWYRKQNRNLIRNISRISKSPTGKPPTVHLKQISFLAFPVKDFSSNTLPKHNNNKQQQQTRPLYQKFSPRPPKKWNEIVQCCYFSRKVLDFAKRISLSFRRSS